MNKMRTSWLNFATVVVFFFVTVFGGAVAASSSASAHAGMPSHSGESTRSAGCQVQCSVSVLPERQSNDEEEDDEGTKPSEPFFTLADPQKYAYSQKRLTRAGVSDQQLRPPDIFSLECIFLY
jgi:hypothetical protein